MRILKITYLLEAIFIFISIHSFSQDNANGYSNFISAGLNSDSFTGMEIGYMYQTAASIIPKGYYITLNIPLLNSIKQKKLDTWELNMGASFPIINQNKYLVLTKVELFTIKHSQLLGVFVPFGCNLKLTPALKLGNGYFGFQLNYNQTLFTYIKHSDYSKDCYSEIYDSDQNPINIQPRNGFYALTGNHLCLGIEGIHQFNPKISLYFDLGMINYFSKYTGLFDAMMLGQIPFYSHIKLNYKLN